MNRFTVVVDACVLYPAPLRDLLIRLALADECPRAGCSDGTWGSERVRMAMRHDAAEL